MTGDDRLVLRDPELVELLAAEPELLAILDAYAATQAEVWQPATPSTMRRRAFASGLRAGRVLVAGLAAVAIALAVALLPARLGEHGVNVVERALAAVSTGPVLHAVVEVPVSDITRAPGPVSFTVVDPVSGRERQAMATTELWYDPRRQLLRLVQRNEGAVTWELLESPAGVQDNRGRREPGRTSPTIDAALAAFFKGYKQALADGTATVAGSGIVDGHPVRWLRFPPVSANRLPQEVAVDSETYQPLLLRTVCADCSEKPPTYRIVDLEGIGESAANFTPPAPRNPHAVAAYAGERHTIPVAEAESALGREALWAGPALGNLQLASVQVVRPSSHSGTPPTDANLIGRGLALQLIYSEGGKLGAGGKGMAPGEVVTVSESVDYEYVFSGFSFNNAEAGQPLTVAGGAVPPEGEVALSSTQAGHWTAQLRKDGLCVEVNGPSREVVLDVVRALRPVSA